MQYTKQLTVTKNTSYTSPVTSTIKCGKGIIHKVDIVLPPGCEQLVHVALYEGLHPVAPSTEGMTFTGDGEVISFPEFYEFKDVPNIITIKAYNTDQCYDHTILIRIYILPKAVLIPFRIAEAIIKVLTAFFR